MKYSKLECIKCFRLIGNNTFSRHIKTCQGMKTCPICSKTFISGATTCSYSCSNKYFRMGENNGNWKHDTYQSTCFLHHGKKCLVCGEEKIVAAHHVNHNHNDNRIENLVPLCPTHHQYVHSKYVDEVKPIIDNYIEKFKLGLA